MINWNEIDTILLDMDGTLLDLHFDNFFSSIVAAAPTKLGFPISSIGRNMAFKKSTYLQVGGYMSLTNFKSGDDIHLTERFRMKTDTKIDYGKRVTCVLNLLQIKEEMLANREIDLSLFICTSIIKFS